MKLNLKNIAGAALLLLVVSMVMTRFGSSTLLPKSDMDIARTTVMITNLAQNSGGTGVIYKSGNAESLVLTNAHVCRVVKNGGLVTTDNNTTRTVTSYRVSQIHDLCMITVSENLKITTEVASNSPNLYEESIASGHPALLDTIITKGTFSKKSIVTVMTGLRKCEKEDYESVNGWLCIMMGGMPVLKQYTAQLSSSLIMPGSSGSAVFNKNGQIAGLVFAGSGAIGYSFLVPQEYVYNFVNNELDALVDVLPEAQEKKADPEEESVNKKFRDTCKNITTITDTEHYTQIKEYCEYLNADLIQRN